MKPQDPKRPGFRRNLAHYWAEYSNNTGIHGLKYLGEQERSVSEKLWWLVVFCLSLSMCILFILQSWAKWKTSPDFVNSAKTPRPIWQIPFPAVTICPELKIRQRAYNFTDHYYKIIHNRSSFTESVTERELKYFSDTNLVCRGDLFLTGSKYIDSSTVQFLIAIAPNFTGTLRNCFFESAVDPVNICGHLFTLTLTEERVCYTFNILDRNELFTNNTHFDLDYVGLGYESHGWTLENGYPETVGNGPYFPRRPMSATTQLLIVLTADEQDLDYMCSRSRAQGFRVLLHNPAEIPKMGGEYFRAPLDHDIEVAVKPEMITTSENLKFFSPERRGCYFSTERQLVFFRIYTQENCQFECLTNYTLKICGCVGFYMPHNETTQMCGSGRFRCMKDARDELLSIQMHSKTASGTNQDFCNCLPACTSLNYKAEISQANVELSKLLQKDKEDITKYSGLRVTYITIFFKDIQFMVLEKNQLFEIYNGADFLANCGGLLGLFTGFSFLSIVEIIYFLTLRLMCNVQSYGRRFWSGSRNLIQNNANPH